MNFKCLRAKKTKNAFCQILSECTSCIQQLCMNSMPHFISSTLPACPRLLVKHGCHGFATTLSQGVILNLPLFNQSFVQAEQPPALGPDSAQATDSHHSPTQQDLELMDSLDDMLLEMPDPFNTGGFWTSKDATGAKKRAM